MVEKEHDIPPASAESERETMLQEKLGGRTILLVIVSMVAIIELLILVRLAVK